MSCTKEWLLKPLSDNKKSLVDRLLEIRGINNEDAKREFLYPLELTLTHPNAFCDMQKAVKRIVKAIDEKEKILIYGDFDADGVTSTSVLLKTFKFLGGEVDYYIPNRETEGHGLNSKALVKILSQQKPKLIITVDNGISNVAEIKLAQSLGTDVIITDHHESPEVLPDFVQVASTASIATIWCSPVLGTIFCSTRTVLQEMQCLPSVSPSVMQVGATA